MSFDPLSAAFEVGKTVVEKIWPDPTKQAEQLRLLERLRQDGDIAKLNAHVQLMLAQSKINLSDSQSTSAFQRNWRPAIGWVGAVSLALMYIPKALVMTYIWSWQCIVIMQTNTNIYQIQLPVFPDLGVSDIIGLLMSMLGVAAMRSYDKKNGTDTK
jgi:hypothetical protein